VLISIFVPMQEKISELLIKKYLEIKRDLPWRGIRDAYKIWLSEVILQQTRVNQGMPYYFSFVETYPDVKSLAEASEDEVLKLWQGLGYYSRARNMLRTAKAVYEKYGNSFPSSYHDLIELKGIGNYTASAVASFSANEPYAVVDGNVNRVITRLFGIKEFVDTAAGKKAVAEAAQSILNPKHADLHNQAIMELGALICTPKKPTCDECPLNIHCVAFAEGRMTDYPFKREKKAVKKRFMVYWLMDDGENIVLQKRDEKDIWGGLYQFPLTETDEEIPEDGLHGLPLAQFGIQSREIKIYPTVKHVLTHRQLMIRFVHISVKKLPKIAESIVVDVDSVGKYPFPIVIANFLNKFYKDLFGGNA